MNKEPKVGQKIYVPTRLYLERGGDDFQGGLATIREVIYDKDLPKDHFNSIFIGIEEHPSLNHSYNWKYLIEIQDELKIEFGDNIAHPDPDYREEFNQHGTEWEEVLIDDMQNNIEIGDIDENENKNTPK